MELAAFPGKPLPKPPGHLKAAGRRLWTDIVTQYRIADGAGLALVTTAAEALDRIREAQAAIRKHGALVADRQTPPVSLSVTPGRACSER